MNIHFCRPVCSTGLVDTLVCANGVKKAYVSIYKHKFLKTQMNTKCYILIYFCSSDNKDRSSLG